MKRPSFQFYPSDWLRDTALRTCSTGARGLWMDMICYMHEGTPYGYLKVGEKVILPENLARMVGETLPVVEGWLEELRQANVFDVADDGSICSRRMIRDEAIRNARAAGGKLGGNPLLMGAKDASEDNDEVNLPTGGKVKQNPTPSSSSSSSSSLKEKGAKAPRTSVSCPQDVDQRVWEDWVALRKGKRAVVTETVVTQARLEAEKSGLSLEDFFRIWCLRGSQGLQADWIKPAEKAQFAHKNMGDRNAEVISGLTRGLLGGGKNVKLLGS